VSSCGPVSHHHADALPRIAASTGVCALAYSTDGVRLLSAIVPRYRLRTLFILPARSQTHCMMPRNALVDVRIANRPAPHPTFFAKAGRGWDGNHGALCGYVRIAS
jgi:hypothetical protein